MRVFLFKRLPSDVGTIHFLLVGVLLVSLLALGSVGVVVARMSHVSGTSDLRGTEQQKVAVGVTHVFIRTDAYQPARIQVPLGTVVTWTNQDTQTHTVTIARGEVSTNDIWQSGPLSPGQSFTYTFTTRGTFTYHWCYHPNTMAGVVIVT
jgi:plastocyanin